MLAGALSAPGVLFLASALVTITIAVQTLRIPVFPGRGAIGAALLCAGAWSLAAVVDTMRVSAETKLAWVALSWGPILALPGFMLLFAWRYVRGEQHRVPPLWLIPHCAMIVVTIGITLGNSRLHLTYLSLEPRTPGGPPDFVHGPWFFVAVSYGYVLLLLALATVVEAISRSEGLHRRQYIGIALSMLLPWLVNLCNTLNAFHPFGVDPTPMSFLAAGAIIVFLIKRVRLFSLLPVAPAVLVEAIPDPVLVLDLHHQVVDANAAAFAVIGPSEPIIGRRLVEIAILAPLHGLAAGEAPPVVLALGPDRRFEIIVMPMSRGGRQVARMLLLRDLTRRARLGVRLREDARRDSLTGLYRETRDQHG